MSKSLLMMFSEGVFRLNTNINRLLLPFLIILLLAVTGCTGNNRSGANERNNIARPIGYYSNENHKNDQTGLFADNDGPVTELLDHNLGAENDEADRQKRASLQSRDENGNPPNPTKPLAENDQFLKKDNRFSTGDVNYHDHLNQNINNTGFSTDHLTLAKISDKIRSKVSKVPNVKGVRSVVYGSSVLISVDLRDKTKAESTKKAVRRAIKPYLHGRAATVITDEGSFSRDRNNSTGVRAEGRK
jgi:spore cortex protein